MMEYIEQDITKIQVLNNYALVEFVDDDLVKYKIIQIIKLNYSTKIKSIYIGVYLDGPDKLYLDPEMLSYAKLDDLEKGKSYVAYDPRSIQMKFSWNGKKYHLIRIEDIYCKVEDYKREEE